jgi:hypothetical protein
MWQQSDSQVSLIRVVYRLESNSSLIEIVMNDGTIWRLCKACRSWALPRDLSELKIIRGFSLIAMLRLKSFFFPVSISFLLLGFSLASACQADDSAGKSGKNKLAFSGIPTQAESSQSKDEQTCEMGWAKAKILIKAPADTVWYTVHEERKHDPDIAYSKLLERNENECTLEQKFVFIPIVGSAVCVMKQNETPLRRIDYRLVKSDHFKALEGSWVLTPSIDGKSTILCLSSHVDLGLPIPAGMLNNILEKKLQKRLHHIKVMAESVNSKVAETSYLR